MAAPAKFSSNAFPALLLAAFGLGNLHASVIVSVTPAAESVERYHPLFVSIITTKTFSNGYDPDQVKVDLELTGPQQETILLPCFYKADQNGNVVWEGRFAPRGLGSYEYRAVLTENGVRKESDPFTIKSEAGQSNGFMHLDTAGSSLFAFRFDSGKLWRGIGEDVAWEPGGYTYAKVIPRLSGLGCNMIRIWHSPWHMPIEWNTAPTNYNRASSEYMDQVLTLAEENGVYMMVMLNDYREFSEQWSSSPYSTGKGGPCGSAKEFFTNAEAKAAYKKKLRYYIARWGYSPNIQSLEFFNEIDNAISATGIDPNALAQWHDEMSAYVHSIDPYNHLITSSVSWVWESMWKAPGIDFTQSHLYGPNNKISKLPAESQRYIDAFKKPYVCGEFSRRWESATSEPSVNYRNELHYGMWLGMVQSTPIAPMTWWWDSHFDWGDDFVFKSAAGFSNDIVAKAGTGSLGKLDASVSGNQEVGAVKTGNYAYVWASNYNGSSTANNVDITLSGLPSGNNRYSVEWYDTWNGGFAGAATVTSQNGTLVLSAGTLNVGADKAARILNLDGPTASSESAAAPARRFSYLRNSDGIGILGNFANTGTVDVTLYDMTGKTVAAKSESRVLGNRIDVSTHGLNGAFYILKIRDGKSIETMKITL